MARSELEQFVSDKEQMRLYQQEYLIMQVTERICELMERNSVSRSELADRLGTTKGYITQLLDGRANMTLRKLADVCMALGMAAELQTRELQATVCPTVSMVETAQWMVSTRQLKISPQQGSVISSREVRVA